MPFETKVNFRVTSSKIRKTNIRAMLLALIWCLSATKLAWAESIVKLPNLPVEEALIEPQAFASAGLLKDEFWSLHGQFTNVTQWHPSFKAPYSGSYSLNPSSNQANTNDATLYLGAKLWEGGEVYINPEIDEGFGLSNTLGVAGYPSGEAYKVGKNHPYLRWQRIFFRQVINLGGQVQKVESSANQLAGSKSTDNVTFTVGKFSVADIFDTNAYAHDARSDFLNWSNLDAGAFDYAADAWGYTTGLAVEWNQSEWSLRGGAFNLSKIPNTTELETHFSQYALIGEAESRHQWLDRSGKVKILGFINRGKMANYNDALNFAKSNSIIPDVSLVRHFNSRPGLAISAEQEISANIGIFAKASINDGRKEAFEFTDINKSLAAGISLQGSLWGHSGDTLGLAGTINGLSNAARLYFAAGGLGILIGDGKLPHYDSERILETYYSMELNPHLKISLNYQYIVNPAYNRDMGPVSIIGLRTHAEF